MSIVEQVSTLMANQPTNEQQRITDLERQVAALTNERGIRQRSCEALVICNKELNVQLAALTKENERLTTACNRFSESEILEGNQLAAAQEQITAMTKEPGYWRNCHDIAEATNVALREQLVAAQAVNERLREALTEANALNINWSCEAEPETLAYYSEYREVIAMGEAALAIPSDDSALQARLKEERERCVERVSDMGWTHGTDAANAIRSMS